MKKEGEIIKDIEKRKRQIKEDKEELSIVKAKKDSLKISVREGSANSVMVGTGNSFMTPFALALGASSFQIGFLSSFVGLVGPLSQLTSIHLMEKWTRKKIVMFTVLIQALMWIPIMILSAMFYYNIWMDALPILLIVFYSFQVGIAAIAGPPWFSWMGDLVPEKKRGRYFSMRNRVTGTVSIITMLIAGFALDYFKTKGIVLIGFTILFSVAMFARLYSVLLFKKHYAPKFKLKKGYYFSFLDFIKHSYKNNFGKFVLFVGLLHLAVFIGSPFVAVYMLKQLEFSYVWFTIITLSASVFSLAVLPFWGKISDKYGNRIVLFLCSILIPFSILLWIFSTNKFYFLFVPSLIGGVAWSGFNLAAFNFIYDSVSPQHRAICLTYNQVVLGVGIFIGALIGGAITKYVSISWFGNIFLFLFLVSAIVRVIVVLIFLPQIKEVRKVKRAPMLIKEMDSIGHVEHGVSNFIKSARQEFDIIHSTKKNLGKLFVGKGGNTKYVLRLK